jgi:hypothetical protein
VMAALASLAPHLGVIYVFTATHDVSDQMWV